MGRLHLFVLVSCLVLGGLALSAYKWLVLGFPLTPDDKADVYVLEGHFSFRTVGRPTKFSFYLPQSTSKYLIMDENFVSQGFGLSMVKDGDNRRAIWAIRSATGVVDLFYRAVVRQRITGVLGGESPRRERRRTPRLPDLELKDMELEAAKAVAKEIRSISADTETLISTLIDRLDSPDKKSHEALLLGRRPGERRRAEVAQMILNTLQVPTRLVRGIVLDREDPDLPILTYLQAFYGQQWHLVDPQTGGVDEEDSVFLPLLYGEGKLEDLEGGYRPKTTISARRVFEEALSGAIDSTAKLSPAFVEFSLFSLPIDMQNVYRVILMIPIGALLVTILRNLIGVVTLGTFMPVLIALSFRSTEALWGMIFFMFIVSVALIFRSYLEHLRLLMVPRLASVLCAVVIIMIATSIITHRLGIERGLSVALFPMVIMTMTVERMSILWEEAGGMKAIQAGLLTLVVALLIYYVISLEILRHLMFVFPELLLTLLGVLIMMGRYTGYRLLELKRFNPFLRTTD